MAKLKPTLARTASEMAGYRFDTSKYIVLGRHSGNAPAKASASEKKVGVTPKTRPKG